MLRNFLGNLGSGVIRLLVTVGILVAVYFLIVRPVLDTTEKVGKEANDTIQRSFNQGFGKNGAGVEDVTKTLHAVPGQVRTEIKRSFHIVESHGVLNPKKLVKCIQRAEGDVHKIQRCTVKF
jgi:hypothetical protein